MASIEPLPTPRSRRHTLERCSGVAALAAAAMLAGCRQDMHNQPKFYPQRGTTFYADGRSVRPQEPNTVAREQVDAQSYFLTGLVNGQEADGMPVPVTPELLARGQEQFNVYCAPCHSRTGYGHGMIVQRGYASAANFHSDRLRAAPLGHFFAVITNGYGAMPEYRAQVTPADRWAIAAYIRALQLSQNAAATDAAGAAPVRSLATIASSTGLSPGFADMRFWTSNGSVPMPAAATEPSATSPTPTPVAAAPAAATSTSGAAAAPSASAATPTRTKTPALGPTQVADATKPPAPAKPPTPKGNAAAGKEVYLANCALCHQETLAGLPPKIPALVGIVARTSEDHVRTTVMEGRPDARPMMPAFGNRLTPADIDNLIAYLKSVKAPAE